jgi:hypothetical protein
LVSQIDQWSLLEAGYDAGMVCFGCMVQFKHMEILER